MRPTLLGSLFLSALGLLASARSSSAFPETSAGLRLLGPYASRQHESLNDAQIATVVLTAYQIDIDRSRRAVRLATHADVRRLADATLTAHANGKQVVLALVSRLQLFPQDSQVMRRLGMDAARADLALQKLQGVAFDRAYVDAELSFQQAWIGAVGHALLPRVRSGALRQALVDNTTMLQPDFEEKRGVGGTCAQ